MFVVVRFVICGTDTQIHLDILMHIYHKFKAYLVCVITDLTSLYYHCFNTVFFFSQTWSHYTLLHMIISSLSFPLSVYLSFTHVCRRVEVWTFGTWTKFLHFSIFLSESSFLTDDITDCSIFLTFLHIKKTKFTSLFTWKYTQREL